MADSKAVDDATHPQARGPDGTAEQEPDLTGRELGDFRILRRLGQGGMGQVYLAEQLSLKRRVALKIMRADLAANTTALKRFKHEAEAVARLTHANIVQVYAVGVEEGLHYMALEYVDGRNLREYLAKKGSPDLLLGLSIMRQVAAALQRASEVGIVHRDIKPENILLTRKGEVKVADFGLSRCFAGEQQPLHLTQSGVTMGTPLYMSPEQVQGQEVDPRTDIYSLGVTCYHMFTGQPPFRGNNAFEVAMMHVQAQPVPLNEVRPDLPPELAAIIHKMMAKQPAERYQTCRDLLKDLAVLRESLASTASGQRSQGLMREATGSGTVGTNSGTLLPLSKSVPRPGKPWMIGLGMAVVLLALIAGAGVRTFQRFRATVVPPESTAAVLPPNPDAAREKELVEKIRQSVNPTENKQVREALDARVELGLLYLNRRALPEADAFFKGLTQPPTRDSFRVLGQLGQAMVLAFQDRPTESNKLFTETLRDHVFRDRKRPGDETYLLFGYPELWEMIDRALDHNARNGPLPPGLERLRWTPGKRPGPFGSPPLKKLPAKDGDKTATKTGN
jgi:serine/threonine-protein kinase